MDKESLQNRIENKENLNINKKKTGLNKPFKNNPHLGEKKSIINFEKGDNISLNNIEKEKIASCESEGEHKQIPKIKLLNLEEGHVEQVGGYQNNLPVDKTEILLLSSLFEDSQEEKNINDLNVYQDRENCILLKNFGSDIYNYIREMEACENIPSILNKLRTTNEIRTKMVDWMIEVLSVYKSDSTTFFLAVYILDKYISKVNVTIRSEEIHLLGMTAMFIASKFEDVIPIRINSMVTKIGHNTFSE